MEPGCHDCTGVDENLEGFVLTCGCGWRSAPFQTAEAVGTDWDRHRSAVAAVSERRFGG